MKRYGKVFQLDMGPEPAVVIADAGLMEEVYRHSDPVPERRTPPAWTQYIETENKSGGLLCA